MNEGSCPPGDVTNTKQYCRRVLLCTHIYTLPRGALCWRQLLLEVCTESTRLLLGSDRSPGVTATHSVRYCSVISIRLA